MVSTGRMMLDMSNYYWLLPLFFLVILVWKHNRGSLNPNNLPLPPGPRPLPIIGNILDISKTRPWISYRELSTKYGDVLYLRLLGQSVIILGSPEAAYDLFENRSAKYSDRRMSTMASLMGWEWAIPLMPYGQLWRRTRRVLNHYFHHGMIQNYHASQLREVHRLLQSLFLSPDQFDRHIRHAFGAVMLSITYGIEVTGTDDEYAIIAGKAADTMEHLISGSHLVDMIPLLRYVPAWFPGAKFQKNIAKWRKDVVALREVPYATAKAAVEAGSACSSIVSSLLDTLPQQGLVRDDEELAKNVVGVAYVASVDTSISVTRTFFLAMTLYPEVQKKAQAALDAVLGPHRRPNFSDRDSLPYIEALVKECFRWQLVGPLGFPHSNTMDDEYKGYFIPKGSIIMANAWAFSRDPTIYPNPDEFNPERFLKDGNLDAQVKDPSSFAFGFGRRICPGRHFADSLFWLTVASVLHVFDIGPPVDATGQQIPPEAKMTSSILSAPEKFQCTIKPRSLSAEALVNSDVASATSLVM
ncbi:O-methylsterigmatocystin oxidoreductase [Grifola frondosa]|uniref:O-methylsterigmatocystin oxidoreductase n=1 Tax=Grifola frondosa TaxID=5627 RepID=A0A1C7LKN3_GRIFR|nr:O-methylsterigmatocystin oxidoreductase [Grifola frondosa]